MAQPFRQRQGPPATLSAAKALVPTPDFVKYEVIGDDLLIARTAFASQRAPGWRIVLDPFGFLSDASCRVCNKAHPMDVSIDDDDRTRVATFLRDEEEIVASNAPFVVKIYDTEAGSFYRQRTPYGDAGSIQVMRTDEGIVISGHAWPRLPRLDHTKDDAQLRVAIGQLDPRAGGEIWHSLQHIAFDLEGPMELHAAACLEVAPHEQDTGRRDVCVDASTGESLTGLTIGWTIAGKKLQRHRWLRR